MNEPITWQQILGAVVIIGGLAGLWMYFVHEISKVREGAYRAISKTRDDAAKDIGKVRDDLAEYKVVAADAFARNSDISAVEVRVLGQVANVAIEVRHLRDSIDRLLRELATNKREPA